MKMLTQHILIMLIGLGSLLVGFGCADLDSLDDDSKTTQDKYHESYTWLDSNDSFSNDSSEDPYGSYTDQDYDQDYDTHPDQDYNTHPNTDEFMNEYTDEE
jgi:hypothetical protein